MNQQRQNQKYDSFVSEIIANPHDDHCRLIFADYLEEVGDPRAELIRIQFQLDELSPFDAKRSKLRRRETKVAKEHGLFTSVPDTVKVVDTYGGFVDSVEVTVTRFLKLHKEIFASSPVRKLTLKGKSVKFHTLKDFEALTQLSQLTLRSNQANEQELSELVASPVLKNLKGLIAYSGSHLISVMRALSRPNHLQQLQHLNLSGYDEDEYENDDHVPMERASIEMISAGNLPKLKSLDIPSQTDESLKQLANSSTLENCETLSLHGRFSDQGIQELHSGSSFRKLQNLTLGSYGNGGNGAFDVAGPLPDLQYLAVNRGFSDQILIDIAKHYRKLTTLDLSDNELTSVSVKRLAESPLLANLERLTLTGNDVEIDGVRALVESEHWTGKTNLYLRSNLINSDEIKSLRKEFGSKFGNFGDIRYVDASLRFRQ